MGLSMVIEPVPTEQVGCALTYAVGTGGTVGAGPITALEDAADVQPLD